MSRYRNRNIRNKFFVPSATNKGREVNGTADSGIDVKQSYGEYGNGGLRGYQRRESSSSSSSDGSGIGIIEEGLDTKDSSASSLSWGEDYELQATQLVKDEYERMERVLQCLEPIPPHYDKDEYKLWIRTFPCLSLTGAVPSVSARLRSKSPSREIKASEKIVTAKQDCDKATSSASVSKSPQNPSVINKLLGEHYPAQKHQAYPPSTTVYSNELAINNTINPRTLDIAFGSFLQIAPVVFPKKSNSDTRRHNLILPTLAYETVPKYQTSRRKYTTPVTKTNSDFIVLPPIDLNRSISASSNRLNQGKSSSEILIRQFPESNEEDHVNYVEPKRLQRRKNRFVKLLQD